MPLDPAPPSLQRARGRAEVSVSFRDGRIRLDHLYQQGCAKALLPNTHGPVPEAVLVNTSGGVTGGDHISWSMTAGPGGALTVTTQAAERIYRSTGGAARIETRLEAGPGAALDWLPQETILFDAARLDRTLDADLAPDARLTALETIILGRAAMGERVFTGAISDQWRIRRAGRLVHAEALFAEGDLAGATSGAATLAGARAFATLVHAAPDAETRLDATRALIAELDPAAAGVTAAATAKPGLLILRVRAAQAHPLRAVLIRFLMRFRPSPLPRVWNS